MREIVYGKYITRLKKTKHRYSRLNQIIEFIEFLENLNIYLYCIYLFYKTVITRGKRPSQLIRHVIRL